MPAAAVFPRRACARVASVSACELFPSRPARPGCARCVGGDAAASCAYAATTKEAVTAGRKRRRRPVGVEKLVRAALAADAVAMAGGHFGADYVGADHGFSLFLPLIIGVFCGWAA